MSFYNGILNHDDESGSVNIKGARGAPGIGFKLDLNNDYDMQNKKLVNVKQGTNNNDVITKSQLDIKTSLLDGSRPSYVVNDKAAIYSSTGALHAQSLYLKDTPDNAGNSDEIRIMTEHQSRSNVHLNIPDIQNFDGYGGRPKSEFMITSVDQNVTGKKVFENIEVHDPTSNNQAANKNYVDFKIANNDQFVKKTGDVLTGDLILPHDNYPVQGNTNKAVSYETQREIFLSRKESFPMQADINMNNNFIQDVATPTTSHQGVNKGYCDYNFLNRQKGGVIMGPLSMNRNDLIGIPDTPKYGYSAVNKNYVDGKFVKKVGDTMTGVLNMNNHLITNLKSPTGDNDAVNKKFVTDQITESHITGSNIYNEMSFLTDTSSIANVRGTVINAYEDYINSPHPNRKAYKITINPTSNNLYDAAIQFNISYLAVGKYSIIIEYYPPSMQNVNIVATVNQITINKQMKREFSTYSKLLLQIENKVKKATNAIILQMTGSSVNPFTAYIIIYGVIEWSDYVSPLVYSIAGGQSSSEIDTASFVKLDGSRVMTGNLDMNTNNIINVKEPVNDSDAINKKYFEDKLLLSHLIPSHHENAFKYLLNRDESSSERNITVNGIDDFNGSPHKNKKAFDVDMIYTTGTQNYDSLIGINIYPLPPGKFTIIMEYYYPENINIAVLCQASSAVINKQISKNFNGYIKLLVQFEDQTKQTPDYLYFNIRGSGTTSTNPEGYLVFYGMKEWYDNVYPAIYDHALESSMFEYDNGNMKMNTVLDMNNKKITNLSDGTDANDAINKGQFDTLKNKFDSHQFYIKNHLYMSIFSYRFYDLKEPIKFNYTLPNVSGIEPGLSILSSGLGNLTINELDPISGLQFNRSIRIIIDLGYTINQVTPYTIMLSMTLKDRMQIYFTDASSSVHYPVYGIDKLISRITISTSSGIVKQKPYSLQFKDKQVMLWIHFNPASNRYRINLANHAVADFIGTPPSTFATNKLRINPGNNLINKICYQNQYISADLHYTQILFEEKKNGSHFE